MTSIERLDHVKAWRNSGISRPTYCQEQQLKYSTFMKWCEDAESSKKSDGQFIALSPVSQSGFEIRFPNGIEINYEGSLTGELIKMLQDA